MATSYSHTPPAGLTDFIAAGPPPVCIGFGSMSSRDPEALSELVLSAVRRAGVRAVLEPFFAPTLENEFRVLRQAADGPRVLVERLDRHRLADRWVELPVTGVFEVHDGRITYWRDYFDAATILSQWPSAQAGGETGA